MKKVLSSLAVAVLAAATLSTAAFAGHGGGHGGGHHGGTSYSASQSYNRPSYSAPRVDPVYSNEDEAAAPLAAAVCQVEGCAIIGEHNHDGGGVVAHYYGDGHSDHGEFDHYYGDGHDYHDQFDHSYGDGHENHTQYDHAAGDGHSYHANGTHAYTA